MQKNNTNCLHCRAPLSSNQTTYCCIGCEEVAKLLLEIPAEDRPKRISVVNSKFEYLNQSEFQKIYQFDQNGLKFQFYIEGVHCASCIKVLESLPQILKFIKSAELHFGENTLEVECYETNRLSEVADLISRMGYTPHPIAPGYSLKEKFTQENRKDLMKIAVAAACMGNIMLLSISLYGGLTGEIAVWFEWLQLLLFLPFLLYSALPFYQGAIRSLRFGQMGIDLPITIALFVSFIFSTKSLIDQTHQLYFDSTASFLLLVLSSRYLLKRIQQKTTEASYFTEFFKKPGAWIKTKNEQRIYRPIALIEKGDVILVSNEERIPVDGTLASPRASVDYSVLTGESTPRTITKGMQVLAGTKSYTDQIEVIAEKVGPKTQLGEMLNQVENQVKRKTPLLNQSDKAAQVLITLVLLLAVVFYVFYAKTNPNEAFARALALIVIACPCALALGAPLAISQGLKRALKLGIIIKNPEVLEKAIRSKNIAFDKTGTLTLGSLNLFESPLLSSELKSIILTLESQSHHPIAFALRSAWSDVGLQKIEQLTEIPGLGVSGLINGSTYEFKKNVNEISNLGPSTTLFKDGRKIVSLNFSDLPRFESLNLINQLKLLKFNLFILSGDHKKAVQYIAQKIEIAAENAISNLSPDDKRDWVSKHPQTIMVGDGTNDLLGMGEAYFSIAVKGSVTEALKNSDVYISQENLLKVYELFIVAFETNKVLVRNIIFAILYNIIGGAAALLGYISPLTSAVLMPISSLILLASSYYGTKKLRKLEKEHLENEEAKGKLFENNNCALPNLSEQGA